MTIFLYCNRDKSEDEMTLEHVVPQSLGGAYAPDIYKLRNVCRSCNSNLGLFVDAAFEKSWFVSSALQMSALASFEVDSPKSLPLICMGNSQLDVPGLREDEICESWIGPLSEQVYWIRPKDNDLYWYSGGNPRTTKENPTRAYFMFSERSLKNPLLSWLSFRDAFEGRKKVKKIMCTSVEGADPKDIGFQIADSLDAQRIEFFKSITSKSSSLQNSLSMFLDFDLRFKSKLALGLGFSLFGEKFLESPYTAELRKGLWYKKGDVLPDVRGRCVHDEGRDPADIKMLGYEYAVTLLILPIDNSISATFNIGTTTSFSIVFAESSPLDYLEFEKFQEGIVIVLFRYFQKGFCLPLSQYIGHKLGRAKHPELFKIDVQMEKNLSYIRNL